jgi:hypothetical protein
VVCPGEHCGTDHRFLWSVLASGARLPAFYQLYLSQKRAAEILLGLARRLFVWVADVVGLGNRQTPPF